MFGSAVRWYAFIIARAIVVIMVAPHKISGSRPHLIMYQRHLKATAESDFNVMMALEINHYVVLLVVDLNLISGGLSAYGGIKTICAHVLMCSIFKVLMRLKA